MRLTILVGGLITSAKAHFLSKHETDSLTLDVTAVLGSYPQDHVKKKGRHSFLNSQPMHSYGI